MTPEIEIKTLEQYLKRPLSEEEKQNIIAEPGIALMMAQEQGRSRRNLEAAKDRRQFSKESGAPEEIGRFAGNVAPWSATPVTNIPKGIAAIPGMKGWLTRALYSGFTGAIPGALEFVQPGKTRTSNAVQSALLNMGVCGTLEGMRNLLPARTIASKTDLKTALSSPQAKEGLGLQNHLHTVLSH